MTQSVLPLWINGKAQASSGARTAEVFNPASGKPVRRTPLANRQDVEAARRLCSSRYLRGHEVAPAPEGGLIGLPRNIHKNFQSWRRGHDVWICPTNRVGPIFRFVHEGGAWRFDGPVGLLRPRGEIVPESDLMDPPAAVAPDR